MNCKINSPKEEGGYITQLLDGRIAKTLRCNCNLFKYGCKLVFMIRAIISM